MWKAILTASVLTLLLFTQEANARILMNEVMANEPGSDVSLEWIELFNFTGRSARLGLYYVVDGDRVSPLPDTILGAEAYAVLARDAVRIEEHYGDSSGVWGDADSEDYLLLEIDIALRNSGDTVQLVDDDSSVISFVRWDSSPSDGISLERRNPRDNDDEAQWLESTAELGSTPGRKNSATPADLDLALSGVFEIDGSNREELVAKLTVKNNGVKYNPQVLLEMGEDADSDSVLGDDEVFFEYTVPQIKPEDSILLVVYQIFDRGRHTIITQIEDDQKPADNDTTVTLTFGVPPYDVVINELLPDPETPLETEWIELYNYSAETIEMLSWQICDAVGCETIPDTLLGPEGLAILCQDQTAFRSYYGEIDVPVIEIGGWQSLNNTGDTLYLLNSNGELIDSMFYETGFGDNYSIERIRPSAPGHDLSNWYRSTSGSTPGEENSVAGGFAGAFELDINRKYISPDGDGRDDAIRISYEVLRDSYLTIKVFDIDGRVMRTIFDDQTLSSGELDYDGSDDSGEPLEIGMYVLYAKLTGSVSAEKKIVFAVVASE